MARDAQQVLVPGERTSARPREARQGGPEGAIVGGAVANGGDSGRAPQVGGGFPHMDDQSMGPRSPGDR